MSARLIKGLTGIFVGDFQSERKFTPEGYLLAPANISRTGIQTYRASELGLKSVDANQLIRMYRPPDEVFSPESIASFENQPAADNHPVGDIDATNWRQLAVGDVSDLAPNGIFLRASKVFVRDQPTIEKVIAGKKQLSCGYTFDADMTSGTTGDGEEYDGIQRNIRGNHIAIVDSGRAGASIRIADNNTHGRTKLMTHKIKIGDSELVLDLDENTARAVRDAMDRHDRAMGDSTRALKDCKDALKDATEAHGVLQKAHDEAEKRATTAEKALAKYTDAEEQKDDEDPDAEDGDNEPTASTQAAQAGDSAAPKLDALVLYTRSVERQKKLRAKIPTADALDALVTERAAVVATAKAIVGDAIAPAGKTDPALRAAVVAHVIANDAALKTIAVASLGGVELEKATPAAVKVAFDVLASAKAALPAPAAATGATGTSAQDAIDAKTGAALVTKETTVVADAPVLTGRQLMMYRENHGGKDPPAPSA